MVPTKEQSKDFSTLFIPHLTTPDPTNPFEGRFKTNKFFDQYSHWYYTNYSNYSNYYSDFY